MSYRNDASTAYDSTLLSSVPDPTRAERQEGYDVDLLDEGPHRSPPAPAPDRQPLTDGYGAGAAVAYAHKEGQLVNGAERTGAKGPWYRTRWGITAIVIVIVLIIAGVVGGAVGGSHHHSSTNIIGGNANSGNVSSTPSISSSNSNNSTPGGGGVITRGSQTNNGVPPDSTVANTGFTSFIPSGAGHSTVDTSSIIAGQPVGQTPSPT